jgi:hypothetical protein
MPPRDRSRPGNLAHRDHRRRPGRRNPRRQPHPRGIKNPSPFGGGGAFARAEVALTCAIRQTR